MVIAFTYLCILQIYLLSSLFMNQIVQVNVTFDCSLPTIRVNNNNNNNNLGPPRLLMIRIKSIGKTF